MTSVYIGIGANLGDPLEQCRLAVRRLHRTSGVRVVACSHFYVTDPVGYADQPRFINAVCRLNSTLTPLAILALLRRLERGANRRRLFTNGPRTLDLDLLLWGERQIRRPNLQVPHPRLHLRRFVLVPLSEVQINLRHPIIGKTVDTLLREVDDSSLVERSVASIPKGSGDRRKSSA